MLIDTDTDIDIDTDIECILIYYVCSSPDQVGCSVRSLSMRMGPVRNSTGDQHCTLAPFFNTMFTGCMIASMMIFFEPDLIMTPICVHRRGKGKGVGEGETERERGGRVSVFLLAQLVSYSLLKVEKRYTEYDLFL